jgi:flagellum-specific ATP synthase
LSAALPSENPASSECDKAAWPHSVSPLQKLLDCIRRFENESELVSVSGRVIEIATSHYKVVGLSDFVNLWDCVTIGDADRAHMGQIVRIDKTGAVVKPFENCLGVGLKSPISRLGPLQIAPHASWRGRIVNAFAEPIDGLGQMSRGDRRRYVDAPAPNPFRRARVGPPIRTGVRAIDCFTPICEGQRIGVFAGSGVGKSTLLAMMTGCNSFDAVVVCLVGERGREVREFLDEASGLRKEATVTVASTGDESPMMRRLAPLTAMSIAEFFRDQGASVLLIVDSITRYAHACREVALSAGEPPVAHGYAPSVFADLPKLLERAGPGENGVGSITGVFSVLVDGDNHNDPIADCARSTLDGHIVLDRDIADQGRYPAIDVLKSLSRLANGAWTAEQREFVVKTRSLLAKFEDTRDLRMLGSYSAGADPQLDQAVSLAPLIYSALTQSPHDSSSVDAFAEIAQALKNAK